MNKTKLPQGRPKIKIDQDQFESLCNLQCTKAEIAGFFKCSDDKIEQWCREVYNDVFSAVFKKHSQGGKISLRRLQWQSAQKGNVSMLIWLGRNWLGQTDKTPFEDKDVETLDRLVLLMEEKVRRDKEGK